MTGSRLIFVLWMMLMMCGHQVQSGFPHQVQPEERALAIRLFDEGKFPEALPHFSKLCYNFPYDFQLKYYFGACLVETGNFGTDAEKNLVLASSSDVPARVNFYLGKLYHGQGNWNSAQRYYNRFRNNSAPAEIAELNVDDLISLCFREINPFHPSPSQLARNAPDSVQIDTPADTLFTVIQPDASEKLLPDS
jgi:tetratricopeptide (TPR) repeat protein